ncbi:MAG: HAMP domain-containing sensor histidine kinase [Clostridium sp.]
MKFWKKIFLYSTILIMIITNGVGVLLVENLHKNNLDQVIKDTMYNEENIINSIYLSYDSSITSETTNKNFNVWFEMIFKNYLYVNKNDIENIEIYNSDNKLISSLRHTESNVNSTELLNITNSKKNFLIQTINNEKVLLVASEFKLKNQNYKLVLYRNINYVYESRINNYKTFFFLDILINGILIVGMYLISKKITKPIEDLTIVSIKVANGEYSARSLYKSTNDEIGILSTNFNYMLEVLNKKITELKELNEEKERFTNNLTHEMKTPITSIIGYSDLLLKGNINDDIKFKSLEYINSEGKRLERLSSTLIKLMSLKNNTVSKYPISIKQCIIEAICSLSYKIDDKNISLNMDITDTTMLGDKQLLIVLFINLLENSIKACSNSGSVNITSSYTKDNSYTIYIEDNGVGIPEEDLNKILEPFYMVDKARDSANNGLGLGLSIVKQICTIHHIDLKIISTLNIGTTIQLTFNTERL